MRADWKYSKIPFSFSFKKQGKKKFSNCFYIRINFWQVQIEKEVNRVFSPAVEQKTLTAFCSTSRTLSLSFLFNFQREMYLFLLKTEKQLHLSPPDSLVASKMSQIPKWAF